MVLTLVHTRLAALVFAVATLGPACACTVRAQGYGRVEEITTNGAYYHFVRPGVWTVQVYVMGPVGSPGVYELSEGTTIAQLLALAGGPMMSPRPSSSTRRITVRLFRPGTNGTEPIHEALLDQIMGSPASNPPLEDGDVLTVEVVEKERFSWRDGLSLVSSFSAIALIAERFLLQ